MKKLVFISLFFSVVNVLVFCLINPKVYGYYNEIFSYTTSIYIFRVATVTICILFYLCNKNLIKEKNLIILIDLVILYLIFATIAKLVYNQKIIPDYSLFAQNLMVSLILSDSINNFRSQKKHRKRITLIAIYHKFFGGNHEN